MKGDELQRRRQLAEDFIPLARRLAKEHAPVGRDAEDSDRISVAYEALVRAAANADLNAKGFATYFRKSIEGALNKHGIALRCNGFARIERSRYARAILMRDESVNIPEKLEASLRAALADAMCLDEPLEFSDGEKGKVEETIDTDAPTLEDDRIAFERDEYIRREVHDWVDSLEGLERKYASEVFLGEKTQTQFCEDYRIASSTAKKIQDRLLEEGREALEYIYHNLEEDV